MIKLLVIADDLTGANDTGVQFARQGINTFVTVELDINISALPPGLEVLVVDTESRHLPADEAANRVRKVVESGRTAGVDYFYKKTDSTLRGNLGAELDAALAASGCRALAFIPAFPKAGRYTRGGLQYIGDELLHQSRFALDPLEPITSSTVRDILAVQTNRSIASVNRTGKRPGGSEPSADTEIVIFDCENDSDLLEIGETLRARNLLGLTAGSAGFAGVMPQLLEIPRNFHDPHQPEGPLLILSGSLNKTSLDQADYAEKKGIESYLLSRNLLMATTDEAVEEISRLRETLGRKAAAGENVILRSTAPGEDPNDLLPATHDNQDLKNACSRAALNMGKIAAAALEDPGFNSLAVFGGDTLISVLEAMGASGVHPMEEISPGIVVSRISGASRDLTLISKAGGFGEEDAIMSIISYTKGENR